MNGLIINGKTYMYSLIKTESENKNAKSGCDRCDLKSECVSQPNSYLLPICMHFREEAWKNVDKKEYDEGAFFEY